MNNYPDERNAYVILIQYAPAVCRNAATSKQAMASQI